MIWHVYPGDTLPVLVGAVALCGHVAEVETDRPIGPDDERCAKCVELLAEGEAQRLTAVERNDSRGLGRTQILVLRLLAAGGAKSVRNLAYDWPGLTESAARGAVMRLGNRSLVDVAGWDSTDGRTYTLTQRGRDTEAALNCDEDEE